MCVKAMEAVWEQADLPVLFLEPEGEGCRVVYQNGVAGRLAGTDGCVFDRMPDEEVRALARALREPAGLPGPLFCHVGNEIYAVVLFRHGGTPVCLLQDATAYYNANQRLLDDAILASQAKTSFLSEMSHDIRTPMGAIIGLTGIALSQQDIPSRIRECLEKIKVASGHMMSLLNEVLDMSRIESGRVVIQPDRVSVADLLHEILIVARPQADAGKLSFRLEMGAVEREHILADSVRLKQICLNLLSNAGYGAALEGACAKPRRALLLFSDRSELYADA